MNIANRIFILDGEDRLYRVPQTRFSAMLADPKVNSIPKFASLRVRAADASVELIERKPTRVVRMAFFMLEFDRRGALKVDSLMQQAAAAMEARFVALDRTQGNILEAQSRFVVRGGRWKPSAAVHRALNDAALGQIKLPRL